jgi:hypothetical protein
MNPELRKFILYSVITGALIILGAWPISVYSPREIDILPVYFIVPFVMIVTILFHAFLLHASKGDPKTFIGKFIASSGLKLMIYIAVIVMYVIVYNHNSTVFLSAFFISYIGFTIIEILFILNHLKK